MWLIAFAVLVVLLAVLVVSYPLVVLGLETYLHPQGEEEPYTERDALLEAISELEQAHRAGKLSPQDHEAERRRLEAEYIRLVEGSGTSEA